MNKRAEAGKWQGAAPVQPAARIAGVPLSRWKLLMKEPAQGKKPEPEKKPASAPRMNRGEMEKLLSGFHSDLVEDDSRKVRKAVFLFVKRGHERLHPADAMELLLEVAKGDDGSKQPERMGKERCRLRRRAVALAGRLERNGRFDGDEEGRSMTLTLVRERETIAKIDYKNTPYTRFLIGCISSQANFLKGGAGIARPKARAYQVCCGPALESAIRKGTEGIPESLQGQLRRLGTMIGTGATVSALAAGFAIKIVADAMAGSYSLESTLAAAFFGALAFFYTFGIKSMHKQAREALKTLDVAKLMDILDRYKTAGHGEEGGCE